MYIIDDKWGNILFRRRPYSLIEERLLARMIQRNGPARQRAIELLCEANTAFALSMCSSWKEKVPIDLLMSYAFEGMIEAASRFEPVGKFTSYARHWIRAYIYRGIAENTRQASVPYNTIAKMSVYNRIIDRETQKKLYEPRLEDIKGELGEAWVSEAIDFFSRTSWKSIDDPVTSRTDKSSNYSEFIAGDCDSEKITVDKDNAVVVESILIEYEKWRKARTAYKTRKRDIEIIRKVFSMDNYDFVSYEQVGDEYGITRERVRQIKEEFIHTVRTSGSFQWARNEMKNMFPGSEISRAPAAVVPAHLKRTTSRVSSICQAQE